MYQRLSKEPEKPNFTHEPDLTNNWNGQTFCHSSCKKKCKPSANPSEQVRHSIGR